MDNIEMLRQLSNIKNNMEKANCDQHTHKVLDEMQNEVRRKYEDEISKRLKGFLVPKSRKTEANQTPDSKDLSASPKRTQTLFPKSNSP